MEPLDKKMQSWVELLHLLWAEERKATTRWVVKECEPRDCFDDCTLTIEQWLANSDPSRFDCENGSKYASGYDTKTRKWYALMWACALALPGITYNLPLRCEPRVGYDPVGDQLFFIFKADHKGTTYLVSEAPIHIPDPY